MNFIKHRINQIKFYIQKYGFDETILYLNANELLNTYHLFTNIKYY